MLDEMEQVINRLHSFSLSSWAVQQLAELRKFYFHYLEYMQSCERHPHVMRILAEECVEQVQGIMDDLGIGAEEEQLINYPYWHCYLNALHTGKLFDLELNRYYSAKEKADLFLQDSYLCEYETEYKMRRYAYALSKLPLPEWFYPDEAIGWLEEIITAYFFLWFAVMDYVEELSQIACN